LNYLDAWLQDLDNASESPTLSMCASCPEVQQCRLRLIPKHGGATFAEWVDKRIGGEVELAKDPDDESTLLIGLLGNIGMRAKTSKHGDQTKKNNTADASKAPDEQADVEPAASAQNKEQKSTRSEWTSGTKNKERVAEFLSSLPQDELGQNEMTLREAVLDYIESFQQTGEPVVLVDAAKEPGINQARSDFLPQDVPLRAWLEERVGGEVDVWKDEKGRYIMGLAGDQAKATGAGKRADGKTVHPLKEENQASKDAFFAALPEDGFTPEEEIMREALLNFIDAWKGPCSPSFADSGHPRDSSRQRRLVQWHERYIQRMG